MNPPARSPDTRLIVSASKIAAGVVCMMCGVAGSGKTTWARALERRGLIRLSIDEVIWSRFGRYGVDYDKAEYGAHQATARTLLDEQLDTLLNRGAPAVLDYSFWSRAQRDLYRARIERSSWPWRLLVLRLEPQVLRRRLAERRVIVDADGAFPITDELLDSYLAGFEWPQGEGETFLPA